MRLKWGECTWEEIRDAAKRDVVVVVPFGSVEQHGPMLPVDTDVNIAERWTETGAQLAKEQYGIECLVLPVLPYGMAVHHMRFPGTITLQTETYLAVIVDVLQCVVKHGFRKILLVSGHGGNMNILKVALLKVAAIAAETNPIRISLWEPDKEFSEKTKALDKSVPECQMGIHAARWETSETLADRPHLVRRDKLATPKLKRTSIPVWQCMIHDYTDTGAFGEPSIATAEWGEQTWRLAAEAIARRIKRLAHDE